MAWILGGVLVISVLILVRLPQWLHRDEEMGSVSGQWLAEYRQDRES